MKRLLLKITLLILVMAASCLFADGWIGEVDTGTEVTSISGEGYRNNPAVVVYTVPGASGDMRLDTLRVLARSSSAGRVRLAVYNSGSLKMYAQWSDSLQITDNNLVWRAMTTFSDSSKNPISDVLIPATTSVCFQVSAAGTQVTVGRRAAAYGDGKYYSTDYTDGFPGTSPAGSSTSQLIKIQAYFSTPAAGCDTARIDSVVALSTRNKKTDWYYGDTAVYKGYICVGVAFDSLVIDTSHVDTLWTSDTGLAVIIPNTIDTGTHTPIWVWPTGSDTGATFHVAGYQFTGSYSGNGNDGGTVPASQTANWGAAITVSGNTGTLTKTGYTWIGWMDGSGHNFSENDQVILSHDTAFQARWQINSYALAYNGNGGSGSMSDSSSPYNYGVEVNVLPNTFLRPCYAFTYWNTAANGSGDYYDPNNLDYPNKFSMPASNVTLYAQWARLKDTLAVGRSTGIDTVIPFGVTTGDSGTVFTCIAKAKTGYAFYRWGTNIVAPPYAGTQGVNYDDSLNDTTHITLKGCKAGITAYATQAPVFAYRHQTITATQFTTITSDTPIVTGGTPDSFTINEPLLDTLTFSKITGIIAGKAGIDTTYSRSIRAHGFGGQYHDDTVSIVITQQSGMSKSKRMHYYFKNKFNLGIELR